MVSLDEHTRLNQIIDLAWDLLFENIVSGKIIINKESSLQLHLSKIIFDLGNLYCILPNETFKIEMETNYGNKSIDIVCGFGKTKAAIELKCFMKASNRAKELDCYDALIDIERLQHFDSFQIKKFICLTDNKYYSQTLQRGHGKTVTLNNGTIYLANEQIIPGWAEKWKVKRDKPIVFKNNVTCDWNSRDPWHVLKVDI
ncbi:hypothetical protein SAMN05444671_3948 [Flavobacterium sp. CF108]|uniref:hypothetical protein n=1 Tax=unclassified Flavobacterium TaxID=196869 RepID=UPI0008CD58A1|nr:MULTISPECIES: hypothetical protein [unclassified Flavobacterium]SEO94143.1 hypothetical protein SAMN04487978_4024 [Flavobacterium sp. fv08]SHH82984.1 hypothetical protein SAMN05444671_3948 [Flavobacterium sp. CF108]